MNLELNERIMYNILKHLEEMNNDDTFKERFPGITAQEFLFAKLHNRIKIKRYINIINGKAKRISAKELLYIAVALNVEIIELVK